MRTTRRLLDSKGRLLVGLLATASVWGIASCSDDDDGATGSPDAATPEAGAADTSSVDAAAPDVLVVSAPLPTSDAGVSPVVCGTGSCAVSLETTIGGYGGATEGFCVLLHDGTVACWGENDDGQLGRGADAGSVNATLAGRVRGLTNIAAISHTCGLDINGAIWCWGTGPWLQSPTATTTLALDAVKLPLAAASHIGVADSVMCAVIGSDVQCWGNNADGQVTVPALDASVSNPHTPQTITLPPGAPIKELVVGRATFVVREDGTAVSWGANPPLARISSLFPDPYPKPISLTLVSDIDSRGANACGVANGIPYCWGSSVDPNSFGTPSHIPLDKAVPAAMRTPEAVVQISTSQDTIFAELPQRQCAVGVSGDVYCWGNNSTGQVGDGTETLAVTPVKVVGLPSPASQVKVTARSTCALLRNGQVYCWGDNSFGQLGTGNQNLSLAPVEIVLP